MKYFINIFSAAILLWCTDAATAAEKIIYVIDKSELMANSLTISIRSNFEISKLVLNGSGMGIVSQVKNMSCDGKLIQEETPGVWTIPGNCKKIQWQVPLCKSGAEVSTQQSIKLGDFILFSEASSLPRIQNRNIDEAISITNHNIKSIFPIPNYLNEIPLSKKNVAPLFVIINPVVLHYDFSDAINLTYLLDDRSAISKLPDMSVHAKGLEWLRAITHETLKDNFTIAWLGISAEKVNLSGATGDGILLVNYASDGKLPHSDAMLSYIALHEAFHQLNDIEQPAWVAESLASYYGIRALQISLPNDRDTAEVLKRFLTSANEYQDGLISINKKVQSGDRAEYGAFYTKGIAFWIAVDEALKLINDSLDNHLADIMRSKYEANGEPINLQHTLNLPSDVWKSLRHHFLD